MIPIGISCEWKCKECINKKHKDEYVISFPTIGEIIEQYQRNILASTIIFAGLEPLDSIPNLTLIIDHFRQVTNDTIIIYTGYEIDEMTSNSDGLWLFHELKSYGNILIKFGRYIKDRPKVFNEILGIDLASDNQWVLKL